MFSDMSMMFSHANMCSDVRHVSEAIVCFGVVCIFIWILICCDFSSQRRVGGVHPLDMPCIEFSRPTHSFVLPPWGMNATTENAFCSNASCDAATNNLWNAMQHESGIRQIDTSPVNAEAEKQQQPFQSVFHSIFQFLTFQSADSVIWCDAVVHMSTFVCTRIEARVF